MFQFVFQEERDGGGGKFKRGLPDKLKVNIDGKYNVKIAL